MISTLKKPTAESRSIVPLPFQNGEQWHHALGDVPLSRIVFDPWPGTATEQDLLTFVERDKRLVELLDGTLVEKPVGYDESTIGLAIAYALISFVRPRKLGVVSGADSTLRLSFLGRIRLPDVAFVSSERYAALPQPHPSVPTLAPDLAVEVLSATNTNAEMKQKMIEYFGSGTRLVWIVDPKSRTVAIHTSSDQPESVLSVLNVLDGGTVLPDFRMPVSAMFEDIGPVID